MAPSPLLVDGPADAPCTFVFAHGAGAGMDSDFMAAVGSGLGARGVRVVRFEFPYMARVRAGEGRAPPDRTEVLEEAFRSVAREARGTSRLFVGGKSMGGRMATHVADDLEAAGVIAFGYPFHPPKKPTQLRTAHLAGLRTPGLIVQGTRDPFGTREEVATYTLAPTLRVVFLEDGDHSFVPRKKSGHTETEHVGSAIDLAARFITDPHAFDAGAPR
jgi:predicted alpha/beta-hydrolase family hydrolase